MRMMEEKVKKDISIGEEIFPELIAEVSSSIEELREIALNLRPSFFEEMSISDAIRWFGKKFQESLGIEIRVQAQDSIEASSMTKDNIFRIYQEALNNVLKHSDADCVQVMLNQSKGRLSLEIKDNGKGFDCTRAKGNGIGLSTIRERAELLGGIFRMKSSEEIGTTIYIEVPLE